LYELNYSPAKVDPDVWIRPGIKLDGTMPNPIMIK
jgi:hypothetical protein